MSFLPIQDLLPVQQRPDVLCGSPGGARRQVPDHRAQQPGGQRVPRPQPSKVLPVRPLEEGRFGNQRPLPAFATSS